METDLQRSADRIVGSEDQRAKQTGFGTNKQGQAIVRRYREQLADAIEANRAAPAVRERQVWAATKDIDIDDLATRLLVADITVCYADDLGTDSDGQKNCRDIALWIARNLAPVRDRALAAKVGTWGVNRLLALPIFQLGTTFEDGGRSVEAGIAEMHDRMRGGRFKIFRGQNDDFIEEMALYHRKDGLLVKESDDAISAVRYGLMAKRHGQTERGKASFNREIVYPKMGVI